MKMLCTVFLVFTLFTTGLYAQPEALPSVFVLGEYEEAYEAVKQDYSRTLLEVTNYDTEAAFGNWMEMMQALQDHAEKLKYDLKGVKVWLHAFWAPDGSIEHFGYLLRPDSRNVDQLELAAVLKTFMKKYRFPIRSDKEFSHYTGANFPIYSEKVDN